MCSWQRSCGLSAGAEEGAGCQEGGESRSQNRQKEKGEVMYGKGKKSSKRAGNVKKGKYCS
jgi:hypothetical protein